MATVLKFLKRPVKNEVASIELKINTTNPRKQHEPVIAFTGVDTEKMRQALADAIVIAQQELLARIRRSK